MMNRNEILASVTEMLDNDGLTKPVGLSTNNWTTIEGVVASLVKEKKRIPTAFEIQAALDPRDEDWSQGGGKAGDCPMCGSEDTHVLYRNSPGNGMYGCWCDSCDSSFATDEVPEPGLKDIADASDGQIVIKHIGSKTASIGETVYNTILAAINDLNFIHDAPPETYVMMLSDNSFMERSALLKMAKTAQTYSSCPECGHEELERESYDQEFGGGEWAYVTDITCVNCGWTKALDSDSSDDYLEHRSIEDEEQALGFGMGVMGKTAADDETHSCSVCGAAATMISESGDFRCDEHITDRHDPSITIEEWKREGSRVADVLIPSRHTASAPPRHDQTSSALLSMPFGDKVAQLTPKNAPDWENFPKPILFFYPGTGTWVLGYPGIDPSQWHKPSDIINDTYFIMEFASGKSAYEYAENQGLQSPDELHISEVKTSSKTASVDKYINPKFPLSPAQKALAEAAAMPIISKLESVYGESRIQVWGNDNDWGGGGGDRPSDEKVYIAWEEGPFEWVHGYSEMGTQALDMQSLLPKGYFAEPVTSWMLGIYDDRKYAGKEMKTCVSCTRSWAGTCPLDKAGKPRNSAECGAHTTKKAQADEDELPTAEDEAAHNDYHDAIHDLSVRPCTWCGGKGWFNDADGSHDCMPCDGTGWVEVKNAKTAITEGQRVRITDSHNTDFSPNQDLIGQEGVVTYSDADASRVEVALDDGRKWIGLPRQIQVVGKTAQHDPNFNPRIDDPDRFLEDDEEELKRRETLEKVFDEYDMDDPRVDDALDRVGGKTAVDNSPVPCTLCGGSGKADNGKECGMCRGTGTMSRATKDIVKSLGDEKTAQAFPYAQDTIDYFINGNEEGNDLTDVFKERFERTGKGDDIYMTLSQLMLDYEYSYADNMEDLNEQVKEIVGDDPNYGTPKTSAKDRRGNELSVGDSVVYSREFLRSIGAFTGDLPFDRGTITAIEPLAGDREIATVQWDIQGEMKVLTTNLTRADRIHLEADKKSSGNPSPTGVSSESRRVAQVLTERLFGKRAE